MKVLVTGGTGFVGGYVVRRLIMDGHEVRCTARGEKQADDLREAGAEPVRADVTDRESLEIAMRGCDAGMNLVGIIKEYPGKGITFEKLHQEAAGNFAAAAAQAGVGRIIHMSALGTRAGAKSDYHKTKYAGEQAVKKSGVPYVIFRPSAQIGVEGEFTQMMVDLISKAPALPVFGNGLYKMQPMDVDDTAKFFSAAVDNPEAHNKVYEVGGPEVMTYLQLLDAFADALEVRRVKMKIPDPVSSLMVSAMQILPSPPITRTQYIMLREDNTCDNAPVLKDFPGVSLNPIQPILRQAAHSWRG